MITEILLSVIVLELGVMLWLQWDRRNQLDILGTVLGELVDLLSNRK